MWLSHSFTSLFVLFICSASLSNASYYELAERAIECSDPKVDSLISSLEEFASEHATPFCTSYLHYTQPVTTTTVTTTSTYMVTSTEKQGTVTVTTIVTKDNKPRPGSCRPLERRHELRGASITEDSAGNVLGYARDIVSGACSCLILKPTGTSTATRTTSTVITSTTVTTCQETKIVTTTTKASQTTKRYPTSRSSMTTTSSVTTSTSLTASTTRSTTTTTPNAANPTFYIQFKDTNPSRTDQYNGQYMAATPLEMGLVWNVTALLTSATLVYLELDTGYLRTVADGFYANADGFIDLAPVYFDTAAYVDQQGYQYFNCTLNLAILTCSVPYPDFRSVIQTCPEYVEFYDTPVALGDREYTDGPVCYAKQMVTIPV